ncbi:MAG: sigma-70 family RNA polymerase sigma factor, partial [Rikenellaceae bacterium]
EKEIQSIIVFDFYYLIIFAGMKSIEILQDDAALLLLFNKRELKSFCTIYRKYFNRLYYFANRVFNSTSIDAEDVIQDVFTAIWDNKSIQFHSIDHIISYMYLSIRNRYKDHCIRQERVNRYTNSLTQDMENFQSYILESETLSIISEAIELLPEECGKVFRMHIEGWEIKEIAEQLHKSPSTVYNQRKEAVEILRKKISKNAFSTFLLIV